MFDALLDALEEEMQDALGEMVVGLLATARTRLESALAEVAKERAQGLAEVASERADLHREIDAMHKHKESHEGHVELNIGGYRFQTSVQTLRRLPHTFFDAYFSGRYAQDVCNDGSIFVDRDGEHFCHVLEYMRDGCVSVAEPGTWPSVSLLRALKREFGFYCIELVRMEPTKQEMTFVMGGCYETRDNDDDDDGEGDGGMDTLSSMEQYDDSTGQWSAVASMSTPRDTFGVCVIQGDIYVTGGINLGGRKLSSVEMYSPSSDTWSALAPLPAARSNHAAVAVESTMYVLGGMIGRDDTDTDTVLRFDITEGTWNSVAPMPEPRHAMAACAVGSDIFVFGGSYQYVRTKTVFKYDTVANTWSTLGDRALMPFACSHHSVSVLDGMVYLVGVAIDPEIRDTFRYDPLSTGEQWSLRARTLSGRNEGASFVNAGKLYAMGGEYDSSVERYDVASDTWTAVGDSLEVRKLCGAVTITSFGPEEHDLFDTLLKESRSQRQ